VLRDSGQPSRAQPNSAESAIFQTVRGGIETDPMVTAMVTDVVQRMVNPAIQNTIESLVRPVSSPILSLSLSRVLGRTTPTVFPASNS
jgi:hypothetical protein